jgi:two-component system response regulator HupR/HoxA
VTTLLIVDDSETDLLLLQQALMPEGFRILTAIGPEAGLELLAQHGADIVISDYQMPNMTGLEFLMCVKKQYSGTVRVIASGMSDPRALIESINDAGIHKFLSKNWDPARIRAEVKEAYRQRAAA